MDESRESEIIREVLLGDAQAFGTLVRRYQGPVYNLMLRYTGDVDEAADVAQEAFVRAYERLESFKLGKRFFPWLYALAMNVARDWLRKKGRDAHVFMEDASVMMSDADRGDSQAAMDGRLDGAKAFEAILKLEPNYREVLILRFRHEFSIQEIAETLGLGVSAVKMRISRGLDMIRQEFQEESDV